VPEKIGMEPTQATAALDPQAARLVLGLFPPVGAVHGSLLCPKKSAWTMLRQRERSFVQALVFLGGARLPAAGAHHGSSQIQKITENVLLKTTERQDPGALAVP